MVIRWTDTTSSLLPKGPVALTNRLLTPSTPYSLTFNSASAPSGNPLTSFSVISLSLSPVFSESNSSSVCVTMASPNRFGNTSGPFTTPSNYVSYMATTRLLPTSPNSRASQKALVYPPSFGAFTLPILSPPCSSSTQPSTSLPPPPFCPGHSSFHGRFCSHCPLTLYPPVSYGFHSNLVCA